MALTYTAPTLNTQEPHKWTFDATGDGVTSAVHNGGPLTLSISDASTMGGGTVTWQWSPDKGTTYCNVGSIAWTAATDGAVNVTLAPGLVRPVVAGGAGPYAIVVFAK